MLQMLIGNSSFPWSFVQVVDQGITLDVSSQDTSAQGAHLNSAGDTLYVAGQTTGLLYQYSLSQTDNLGSGSYASLSYDAASAITPDDNTLRCIFVDPTETYAYVGTPLDSEASGSIYQFTMSSAGDISTCSLTGEFVLGFAPSGVYIDPTGTYMFVTTGQSTLDRISRYTLSTPWDVTTATSDSNTFSCSGTQPHGIFFKPDGTRAFYVDRVSSNTFLITCPTPWSFSGASETSTYTSGGGTGIWFNDRGTKMYTAKGTGTLYQFNL